MTASVITKLAPVVADRTWTETPYALEIKGKTAHGTTVKEVLDPDTGKRFIRITTALTTAGKPSLPLPTQDQVARNIRAGATVRAYVKGPKLHIREYAV